jgi:hypothetical protein
MRARHAQLVLPIPSDYAQPIRRQLARPRRLVLVFVLVVAALVFASARRVANPGDSRPRWPTSVPVPGVTKPVNCVFGVGEIRNIYTWEVESGNYPSRRRSACGPRVIAVSAHSVRQYLVKWVCPMTS